MSDGNDKGKGKERAPSASNTEDVSDEYLLSLLNKAREKARAEKQALPEEEEVISVMTEGDVSKLTPLRPKDLPTPYFQLGKKKTDVAVLRNPDAEAAERAVSSFSVPAPPVAPPELTKSGKPLTKRERKQLRNKTAGPDWFDLPAPAEADLPRLYREVEALRLRNQLDPKRFYRKEEGESKGIKGLPEFFAIGTVVSTSTPFGTQSSDNLTRAERKRTLVDELVDDAEAKRYAKRKFEDLQTVRGAKGRNTLNAKKAARRPKW